MTGKVSILPFNFSVIIFLAGHAKEVAPSSNVGEARAV